MTSFIDPTKVTPADPAPTKAGESNVQGNQEPANQPGFIEWNGRKMSADDIAKKLSHADGHIARLEAERQEDRKKMDEITELLKKAVGAQEVLAATSKQSPPATSEAKPVDEDAIVQRAVKAFQEGAQQSHIESQRLANFEKVRAELTTRYGGKADEVVGSVAKQHGLSLDEAVDMARTKPGVFLALFPQAESPRRSFTSTVNSAAVVAPTKKAGFAKALMAARSTREQVDLLQERLKHYVN